MDKTNSPHTLDEELNSFFYEGLNHSLMTPLNIIKGMNEIILEEDIPDTVCEYIHNSMNACELLELYIYRLILFSKLSSQYIEAIDMPFSLHDLLKGALTFSVATFKKNHVAFDFNLSVSLPDMVNGDCNLLKQIMFNIISDISINPGVSAAFIDIDWQRLSVRTGYLKIRIDTDINKFPDDNEEAMVLKNIFEKLCSIIGGDVYIKTIDGITSAYIKIPLDYVKEAPSKNKQETRIDLHSFTVTDAKILIVDDNSDVLRILTELLKHTKISIDTAESGADALKLLEAGNEYDIIFLDYLMPKMNGYELIQKIKKYFPDLFFRTPIFVLSASTNTDIRQNFKEAGFSGFIPKPLDSGIFAYIIKSMLPPDKVQYIDNRKSKIVTADELNQYRECLKHSSINLDEGLHYTSHDFEHYLFIARLYLKTRIKNKGKLKQLINNEDWESIRIYAHTIKGNAKQIGADTLYSIAAQIEERCAAGDYNFVRSAERLFTYIGGETTIGLERFVNLYDSIHKDSDVKKVSISEHNPNSYKGSLIKYISNMEYSPAADIVSYVISQQIDEVNIESLKKIADYLDEFDFNEALLLAKEL